MNVPDWWTFVLLGLASFRLWRIVAVDEVTRPIRDRVFRMDAYQRGDEAAYRFKLDEFVACPWCFGWWVVLAWWGLWQVWGFGVEVASAPLALSTAVGFLAKGDK